MLRSSTVWRVRTVATQWHLVSVDTGTQRQFGNFVFLDVILSQCRAV